MDGLQGMKKIYQCAIHVWKEISGMQETHKCFVRFHHFKAQIKDQTEYVQVFISASSCLIINSLVLLVYIFNNLE